MESRSWFRGVSVPYHVVQDQSKGEVSCVGLHWELVMLPLTFGSSLARGYLELGNPFISSNSV